MAEQAIDRLPVELWRKIFDEILLSIGFHLPLQSSVPWSRRKNEFDEWTRYFELLKNRERLSLVAKRWYAFVKMYPWRHLDLVLNGRLDRPPPDDDNGGVYWVVYPLGEGRSGDGFEALVQSPRTIAVLTLVWHLKSSLTRLYSVFAHASNFSRLQELIVTFASEDRTSNDLATHTFLSHINAFSSTLISLRLSVHLYNSNWFESPPVLRLANLLHLDLCFGGLLEAFNIPKWNLPKLAHLKLTGNVDNTDSVTHLAPIGSNLRFLALQRITNGRPCALHIRHCLDFNCAFWGTFPLLEVLKFDAANWWSFDLSDLPLAHPIRELIVQCSDNNFLYGGMDALWKKFIASNETAERKRRVIMEGLNWNDPYSASLKWNLKAAYARVASSLEDWLEDEEGVSLRPATIDGR